MAQKTTSYTYHDPQSGLSLNVKNPKDAPLPPTISAETFNKQGGVHPETVVSRNADGNTVSRFKDPTWDFSAFMASNQERTLIHFSNDEKLNNEVKTILMLEMITPTTHKAGIKRHKLKGFALKKLANYCSVNNTSISELINTKGGIKLVKVVKENMRYLARDLICIADCLNFLRDKMGFNHGFKAMSKNSLAQLRRISQKYTNERTQSPVIPSRIFKAILHDTTTEYRTLMPILDELLAMQAEIDSNPLVGLSATSQRGYCAKLYGTSLAQLTSSYPINYDLAEKYPLARDFLNDKFDIGKSKPKNNGFEFEVLYDRCSVLNGINYIRRLCHDIIIMLTGMRPCEAETLPYFGSKETIVDGARYWLIYGFAAKKSSKIPPFEMWVTNKLGYQAFQTAKRIADLYYQRNQREPIKKTPEGKLDPEMSPLFLRDNNLVGIHTHAMNKTPCRSNSYIITQFDYHELKMIDPHRVWEKSPEFAVGKPFPVQRKLFRRSIAFFASASGVRIVDLKNQYHHLFESQTFYYSQGSGRANPFLHEKHTFASYFNQVKHEAEAFSLVDEVINFDGKLFGAGAIFAERNQVFETIRRQDREDTIKRVKLGEIGYKETHLGGCMKTTPCLQKALGSVTACLECKDAIIKPDKLARAIKDQARTVDNLDPERLEYRTEISELLKMLDFGINNIIKSMKRLDRRKAEYKQFSKRLKEFKRMKSDYLKKINDTEQAAQWLD